MSIIPEHYSKMFVGAFLFHVLIAISGIKIGFFERLKWSMGHVINRRLINNAKLETNV